MNISVLRYLNRLRLRDHETTGTNYATTGTGLAITHCRNADPTRPQTHKIVSAHTFMTCLVSSDHELLENGVHWARC